MKVARSFYYALFTWRAEPDTAGARAVFGHHRRVGYGATLAGLLLPHRRRRRPPSC